MPGQAAGAVSDGSVLIALRSSAPGLSDGSGLIALRSIAHKGLGMVSLSYICRTLLTTWSIVLNFFLYYWSYIR